jgi:hypothetical protein
VKIINQEKKKDSIIRDMRQFSSKFTSIIDLKVKLMEEFEDQLPPTTQFAVGYFEARRSGKKWLVTQEDLTAMYSAMSRSSKTELCLWCDGRSEEADANSRKRKRDDSPPPSKRALKEKQIDDVAAELVELNSEKLDLSDPQYRLWARMIVCGNHSSKEKPPQLPLITGITPTRRSRKSMEETVACTVSACMKAMASPSKPEESITPQPGLGVSPGKAVDIRGKCFTQLASLKKLYEDSIISEDELQEQKSSILNTLKRL